MHVPTVSFGGRPISARKGTDGSVKLAITAQVTSGWLAIGFSPNGVMVGSDAVLVNLDESSPSALLYHLGGQSSSAVTLYGAAVQSAVISGVSVTKADGSTTVEFTRALAANGATITILEPPATNYFLLAHLPQGAGPSYHGADGRFSASVDLSGSAGKVAPISELNYHRLDHAILMTVGWGVLLPMGVILARYAKAHHPLWFHLHRICNTLGLVLTLAGFILALTQFGQIDSYPTKFIHACLGCTVMSIGLCQPLNAFIRPHPKADGPQPLKRVIWEATHKNLGRVALILSVITNFLGGYLFSEGADPRLTAGKPLIFVYILSCLLGVLGFATIICEGLRATGKIPSKPPSKSLEQKWLNKEHGPKLVNIQFKENA